MIWGTLLLAWAVGVVMHFLYEPLGRPRFLRPLLPLSESAWEHYKMAFWPLAAAMAWLAVCYGLPWHSAACAALAAALHAMGTMFGLFYIYVSGLGVGRSVMMVDILCFVCTMFSGYFVGVRLLASALPAWLGIPALAGLVLIAYLLARFSVRPPDLPMFRDGGL